MELLSKCVHVNELELESETEHRLNEMWQRQSMACVFIV